MSTARRVVLLRPGSLVKDVKASEFLQLDLEACHLSLSHHFMTFDDHASEPQHVILDAQNISKYAIDMHIIL